MMNYPETDPWIYTTALAIPILGGFACMVSVPPLIIYIRARNIPVSVLFLAIVVETLLRLINALLWPETKSLWRWNGDIFCDIQVKLLLGFDMASVSSVACTLRQLAGILNPRSRGVVPSERQKNWDMAVEIFSCVAVPALIMSLHYIVQPQRYFVYPIHGCTPSFDASWPSYVIILCWPAVTCLAATVYGLLTVTRMIRHRREMSNLLINAQNKLDQRQFTRLFILASVLTILFIPTTALRLYSRPAYWYSYSWSRIHPPDWSDSIVLVPSYSTGQIVSDLVATSMSLILFVWFSFGREPLALYKSLFNRVRRLSLFTKGSTRVPRNTSTPIAEVEAPKELDDTELVLLSFEEYPSHPSTTNITATIDEN